MKPFPVPKRLRKPGIEPGAQRWQRWILPLNHLRLLMNVFVFLEGHDLVYWIRFDVLKSVQTEQTGESNPWEFWCIVNKSG